MSLRVLIVDDEPPARSRLRSLIEAPRGEPTTAGLPGTAPAAGLAEVVGEAADGAEAVRQTALLRPDVVLLDIRMPVMDGLEAAAHLGSMAEPPAVVFCTAYDDHALAAFEAGAIDYLLKPVRAARLAAALARARRLQPHEVPAREQARTHLGATLNGELRLVPVSEVRVLRAEHKYVSVYAPGTTLVLEASLAALEDEFAGQFLRVHRNALVARRHVTALLRGERGALAVSIDGFEPPVEVSRRLAAGVRRALRA